MRRHIAILVTLAALTLLTLPAAAQNFGPPAHGHDHGHDAANPILHMTKELGLNEQQTAQVKAIAEKFMAGSMGEAMNALPAARLNVQNAIHDVKLTDDQVREAAAVVAGLDSQIAVLHHQMAMEISKVLDADQRAKLADMFSFIRERGF